MFAAIFGTGISVRINEVQSYLMFLGKDSLNFCDNDIYYGLILFSFTFSPVHHCKLDCFTCLNLLV